MDEPLFNPLGTMLGAAVTVPYFLQFVKKFFPNLTPDALNMVMKAFQMLFAIAVSVGVQYNFDQTTGTLVVSGLTPQALVQFIFQVLAQYKSFEVVYRAAIKPYAPYRP